MKRGEVWWVIGPKATVGTEIRKTRPALIISNEASIRRKGRATIIPLSSKTARLYPPETIVTVGGQLAKALVDQIGTADNSRFTTRVGALSQSDLGLVAECLREHLEL